MSGLRACARNHSCMNERSSSISKHARRRNLEESDTFFQIQTAYHADAADVRPRLPVVGAQIELAARYLCVQKRCPDSVVGFFEVVRQSAFFAIHASIAF